MTVNAQAEALHTAHELNEPEQMLETCGSAGKDVKEGAPSRMMIES
jgi:hypothetical protein